MTYTINHSKTNTKTHSLPFCSSNITCEFRYDNKNKDYCPKQLVGFCTWVFEGNKCSLVYWRYSLKIDVIKLGAEKE
jgi:hypothetical protein